MPEFSAAVSPVVALPGEFMRVLVVDYVFNDWLPGKIV